MFPRAVRLGQVRGIAIRVDPTWVVIAALVTLSFWQRFRVVYGHPVATAVVLAVVTALLFFASLLAHELAHAIEGQHRDIRVEGITLFLFGGVTEMHLDARRPRDEFMIAAVGPYASLVAAAVFGLVATLFNTQVTGWSEVSDAAGMLAWINLGLAVFNLLPGAPLDGGRVLRAALWAATRNRARAVRLAAHAGQLLGALVLALGVWQATTVRGAFLAGLWFVVIGWFMLRAAGGELALARFHRRAEGRTADSVLPALPHDVDAESSLADLDGLLDGGAEVVPVTYEGRVVGALRLADVAALTPGAREERLVGHVMQPLSQLPKVEAGDELADLLRHRDGEAVVRVMDSGDVAGFVTPAQLDALAERLWRGDGVGERR